MAKARVRFTKEQLCAAFLGYPWDGYRACATDAAYWQRVEDYCNEIMRKVEERFEIDKVFALKFFKNLIKEDVANPFIDYGAPFPKVGQVWRSTKNKNLPPRTITEFGVGHFGEYPFTEVPNCVCYSWITNDGAISTNTIKPQSWRRWVIASKAKPDAKRVEGQIKRRK